MPKVLSLTQTQYSALREGPSAYLNYDRCKLCKLTKSRSHMSTFYLHHNILPLELIYIYIIIYIIYIYIIFLFLFL